MTDRFFEMFERLVPESGQAGTVQGEVVRAIGRMADDYFTNGSANWDAGFEMLSAFVLSHLTDGSFGPQSTAGVSADIGLAQAYGRGEGTGSSDLDAAFDRLMEAAVAWCDRHPVPIAHRPNPDLKR